MINPVTSVDGKDNKSYEELALLDEFHKGNMAEFTYMYNTSLQSLKSLPHLIHLQYYLN